MQHDNQPMTTGEVAQELGVSSEAVRAMVARRELPAMRTPKGHRIFLRRDVERKKAQRDAAKHAKQDVA